MYLSQVLSKKINKIESRITTKAQKDRVINTIIRHLLNYMGSFIMDMHIFKDLKNNELVIIEGYSLKSALKKAKNFQYIGSILADDFYDGIRQFIEDIFDSVGLNELSKQWHIPEIIKAIYEAYQSGKTRIIGFSTVDRLRITPQFAAFVFIQAIIEDYIKPKNLKKGGN